jgi:hypothetical protein
MARVWGLVAGSEAAEKAETGVKAAGSAVATAKSAATQRVQQKAGEAKAAVSRGVEKAKTAAVELVGGKPAGSGETKTAVQQALEQRYEKSDTMGKSVKEILRARYLPIDQQDNTRLRGI